MGNRPLDLSGQKFGNLTVIEKAGKSKRGAILWLCHCGVCGNNVVLDGARVKAGKTDCGCVYKAKRADLSGKTFGALTVLKRIGSDNHGNITYLCRCDICGEEKEFPACTIRDCPKSCGCLQYAPERMKRASDAAIIAMDGANIADIFKTEARPYSKTGVRGVFPETRNPHLYRFSVQVHGERITKTGFTSIESAKRERDQVQQQLIEKYGLKPKKKKKKK